MFFDKLLSIIFRLIHFWEECADSYRSRYYLFKYFHRVKFGIAVGFGKGTYIYFISKESTAKLSIGEFVIFRRNCGINLEFAGDLSIGNYCFFNNGCSINCLGNVVIGNNVLFGENVKIYDHNHVYSDITVPISGQGFSIGSVNIGDNCWIGSNCVILNNVTIGTNVIIGANNLIYKSIPDNSIIVAKVDYLIKAR